MKLSGIIAFNLMILFAMYYAWHDKYDHATYDLLLSFICLRLSKESE